MKLKDKNTIIKWADTLTNEELEKEYYDNVFDCLGSDAEIMYERGYDVVDIREQEKLEKYQNEKTDILEQLCIQRGIVLWKKNKHP